MPLPTVEVVHTFEALELLIQKVIKLVVLYTWSKKDSIKRARQAKNIHKRIVRMDLIDKPILQKKRMKLEFEVQKRSGEMVIKASIPIPQQPTHGLNAAYQFAHPSQSPISQNW